jgi:hypothetical protein
MRFRARLQGSLPRCWLMRLSKSDAVIESAHNASQVRATKAAAGGGPAGDLCSSLTATEMSLISIDEQPPA